MFPRLSIVISLSLASVQAAAQQAEICNAALSSGLKDNYYILTGREQYEEYQKRLCSAQFNTHEGFSKGASSFGLNLQVAEAVIGLTGDQSTKSRRFSESYSSYCESTYFDASYKDRFISYSSRISEALAGSWLECQKAHVDSWLSSNQYGLFLAITPQDNFSDFTIRVERKTTNPDPIVISDITPAGTMECYREGAGFEPGIEIDRREFSFNCSKPPNRSLEIALDTSDGLSNTVRVPSQVSKFSELNEQLSAFNRELQQENADLAARVNSLEKALNERISNLEGQAITHGNEVKLRHGNKYLHLYPNERAEKSVILSDGDSRAWQILRQ